MNLLWLTIIINTSMIFPHFYLGGHKQSNIETNPYIANTQFKEVLHLSTLDPSLGDISWISWSPIGNRLAFTYRYDNVIRIIDPRTGLFLNVLKPPVVTGGIVAVSWSPDGKKIASAINDPQDEIIVWDLSDFYINPSITIDHIGQRPFISWGPDSKQLLSIGAFGQFEDQWKVFVWDTTNGKLIKQLDNDDIVVKAFWSPDGKKIATLTKTPDAYYHAQIRDATTFQVLNNYPDQDGFAAGNQLSWNSSSTKLAGATCNVVTGGCSLWVWDAQENKFSKLSKDNSDSGNVGPFASLALTPNGKFLAVNDSSEPNYIWDTATGKIVSSLDDKTGWISCLGWSPDSTMLVTGDSDGSISIWVELITI